MKKYDAQLKENFNEIMDAVSDDLLISNGEGLVIRVSPDFEKLYGINEEEAVGQTVFQLEEKGYFKPSVIAQVLKEKKKITMTQKIQTDREVLVTATPVFDDAGKIKLVVSFSRDITEMSELQKRYSRLRNQIEKYTAELQALRKEAQSPMDVIGNSVEMEHILDTINRVADLDVNVLMLGPSGVGKTMLAKVIHQKSVRAGGPFIDINCAAIPENLLESELFGYEKGAFTGASNQGKIGLMELADKGTLLLDEISEIPLTLQAKLLKAIQDKTITRVGGRKPIKVDFRLIAASNRDLEKYSDQEKFRKDLYYRLNVVNLKIPPLSERKADIIPLIEFFTEKFNGSYGLNKSFGPKAMEALMRYSWPGNIRELSNVVERTLVTADGSEIQPGELPEEIFQEEREKAAGSLGAAGASPGNEPLTDLEDLPKALEDLERSLVCRAYRLRGTTVGVAEQLKISQPTAVRKIKKYVKNTEKM